MFYLSINAMGCHSFCHISEKFPFPSFWFIDQEQKHKASDLNVLRSCEQSVSINHIKKKLFDNN